MERQKGVQGGAKGCSKSRKRCQNDVQWGAKMMFKGVPKGRSRGCQKGIQGGAKRVFRGTEKVLKWAPKGWSRGAKLVFKGASKEYKGDLEGPEGALL